MNTNELDLKVHRMTRLKGDGKMKAFVDLLINDVLVVRGLRVVDGKNGLFVSMPQEKGKDNKWYDMVKCLDQDMQRSMNAQIVEAYEKDK